MSRKLFFGKKKTGDLKETNTALKVLLRQREDDRGDLEQSVLRNVRERVLPYVEKLKTAGLRSKSCLVRVSSWPCSLSSSDSM